MRIYQDYILGFLNTPPPYKSRVSTEYYHPVIDTMICNQLYLLCICQCTDTPSDVIIRHVNIHKTKGLSRVSINVSFVFDLNISNLSKPKKKF